MCLSLVGSEMCIRDSLYEAGAIVLVAIAVIILRLRYVPILRPIEDVDEIKPRSTKK